MAAGAPLGVLAQCPVQAAAVVAAINAQRARGANCGARGVFQGAPPLAWHGTLLRVAEAQALFLATRDDLRHTGAGGEGLGTRALEAGYRYRRIGETLAHGQPTFEEALSGWLASDAHCSTLHHAAYTEMAAACRPGADGRPLWVLVLGRPQ
jgi:uncharacterized protein YkwD